MDIKVSAHGAHHHQYHVVWIPNYRRKILKGQLKEFVGKHLFNIQEYHPDIEIERYRIQKDHVHLIIIIAPNIQFLG